MVGFGLLENFQVRRYNKKMQSNDRIVKIHIQ